MSILDKTKELKLKLDDALQNAMPNSDLHVDAGNKLLLVRKALENLTYQERRHHFQDNQEEITYFKESKPEFYALYIYYVRLRKWGIAILFRGEEDMSHFYKEQLKEIETEFSSNADVFNYFTSGETHLDYQYFLNDGYARYDLLKGEMLALLRLREFISERLSGTPSMRSDFELQWKGTRTELIELLYALYAKEAFGNIPFKKLVSVFGDLLKLDLKNYAQFLSNIKMRKETSQTFFLNTLSIRMQERLDEES